MPLSDASKLGLANRFSVTMDFAAYDLGSWSRAEGLSVTWHLAEYRAGDAGNARWYFPGSTEYSPVKLTRAASEESKTVKRWLTETSFRWKPFTGHIVLHGSGGEPILDWTLRHVMPVRWQITGFDAMASQVAVETLELAHQGFLEDARNM